MRTVQGLMTLAFKGPHIDLIVIAELKTMINAYLQVVLKPGEDDAENAKL
jgi:hypothetical protein